MKSVTTLVFDVMGTVVDDGGSISARTAATLEQHGLDPGGAEALKQDVDRRLGRMMDDVRLARSAWQAHVELRRTAWREALAGAGQAGPRPELVDELAAVIRYLEPWPDSPSALADLRDRFTVVALSNADLAEIAAYSRHGGLAWHLALSTDLVRSFKPDPAAYQLVTTVLGVPAEQLLMVAAHPWDLRAAAEQGFRTAYIARPGAEKPDVADAFDLTVSDLAELAEALGSA